jgi:hypothetical protein
VAARRNGHRHASLYDFRDLDLMLTLAERGDDEGWSTTHELASSFGFGDEVQALAGRLRWMHTFGMVEQPRNMRPQDERLWRLTSGGGRVVEAKLRAAESRVIEAIPDESLIDVMANVTRRYQNGDPMIATMLRREFAFGTAKRKR